MTQKLLQVVLSDKLVEIIRMQIDNPYFGVSADMIITHNNIFVQDLYFFKNRNSQLFKSIMAAHSITKL